MNKTKRSVSEITEDHQVVEQKHRKTEGENKTTTNEKMIENDLMSSSIKTIPKIIYDQALRRVPPYYYQHRTHAKGRWIGQSLLSVFEKEFQDRPLAYYKEAIETGHIRINQNPVVPDTIIQSNNIITHLLHRHEPPVPATSIPILAQTEDWVLINKPAGIPVHPTGRYHLNSILSLLNMEHQITVVAMNRLDRLTSGIMLLSKNKKRLAEIETQFRSQLIQKEYLCRVQGEFPEFVSCNEPILPASLKLGIHQVHPDGKPCETDFKRISYDGHHSIVLALPRTGRTHQIRVHLKHLGFPIVNDPLYSHSEYSSTYSDIEIASLKKKKLDEVSVGICSECKQSLMPDPTPDTLFIYLHALRYHIKANLNFKESEFVQFDAPSNTTIIQTPYPDWAT